MPNKMLNQTRDKRGFGFHLWPVRSLVSKVVGDT